MAAQIKGSRHGDLWQQFNLLVRTLSGQANFAVSREHLAFPALGSFLWDPASTAALNDTDLTNHDFLEALRDLAFTRQDKALACGLQESGCLGIGGRLRESSGPYPANQR